MDPSPAATTAGLQALTSRRTDASGDLVNVIFKPMAQKTVAKPKNSTIFLAYFNKQKSPEKLHTACYNSSVITNNVGLNSPLGGPRPKQEQLIQANIRETHPPQKQKGHEESTLFSSVQYCHRLCFRYIFILRYFLNHLTKRISV